MIERLRAPWLMTIALAACRINFDPVATDDASQGPTVTLTITMTGAGTGMVTGPGVSCSSSCVVQVPQGAAVDLAAAPTAGSWFRGWPAGCASGGRHGCALKLDTDLAVTADFTPEPNRIFISSTTHDGGFGGLAGADTICSQVAISGGLSGTFRAVLSYATGPYTAQLATARGWIRPDGEPVADRPGDLGLAALLSQITVTEGNVDVGPQSFWQIFTGSNCQNWTSNLAGDVGKITPGGRAAVLQGAGGTLPTCNTPQRFLCAQVDRSITLAPVPFVGRLAFVSPVTFPLNAGRATADTLCTSSAAAGGVTGSFLALLATTGTTALSRFDLTGPPWVRADGIPLLPTAAAWSTATSFDVAPALDAAGTLTSADEAIVLGATTMGTVGTDATSCTSWSNGTGANYLGNPYEAAATGSTSACNFTARVMCLQQ